MKLNYSVNPNPEKTSRSMGKELNISRKHAHELSRTIKGMKVKDARTFLENVSLLKQAVPFKRFNRDVPHRKGKMMSGRYPRKAAIEFLGVLENAEGNAIYQGLDPEKMRISHISTKKGRTIRGIFPRAQGRATPRKGETVSVEMVLEAQ